MATHTIIYHNPSCSKSRQTLALLEQENCDIEIVEYLRTPLTHDIITAILDKIDKKPRDIMRTKESVYSSHRLSNPNLSDNELIQAIIDNPILLERPIVLANNKAAIGRPPENILDIL